MTTFGEDRHRSTDLTREFSLWALEALRFRIEPNGNGQFTVYAPDDQPQVFQGAGWVRFHFDEGQLLHQSPGIEQMAPGSRMFNWLLRQVEKGNKFWHAVPKSQPENVRDLSESLFEAYQVNDGTVRLAGCALEDQPLMRLTYLRSSGSALFDRYLDAEGELLPPSLVSSLGLADLQPIAEPPAGLPKEFDLERWKDESHQRILESLGNPDDELDQLDPESQPTLLNCTVIWCKRASGKLAFEIGEASGEVAFDGWATHFANQVEKPPPYVCPLSGHESYELVLVDDQISVPESFVACEETGQRVPPSQLETCAVSGKKVIADQLESCPVTDVRVLRSLLKTCNLCGQQVNPECIKGDRCAACRSLATARKEDVQVARVLDKFPKLSSWPKWSVAETETSLIMLAGSFSKQILLLLDKETLDVQRVARAGRFFAKWSEVGEDQYPQVLG